MKEYRLGDIITIKHGYAFDGEHIVQEDNGIVLVTPGNFRIGGGFQEEKCKFYSGEIPDGYVLSSGDFIVTMTDLSKTIDTLGYSALVPESDNRVYLHNQRIGLVSFKANDCFPGYIYFLMRTHPYQRFIANTSTGSTVHHTSPSKIYDYRFYAPSYEEQREIAERMFAYEKTIKNNQRQIKLLEEAAQRLYKEWFVDLRFPGHENTKITDGVPKGWRKYKFSDTTSIMGGGTPKTDVKEFYNGNIPFYTPKDSDDSFFAFDTITHISQSGLDNCNSQLYPVNTIIITARGTVGKTTILAVPMAMNQSCYALKCDELNSPYYLFFSLKNEVAALKKMANGGVFNTIIVKTFDSIYLIVPTQDVLNMFEALVSPIMEQIKAKARQNIMLAEARDRLLPKLMSGEIEV